MPLAPAIGAALSAGLTAPVRSLWIGGLDVLKRPGMNGNDYGVAVESIDLTEAGPGSVSSLSFTLDDPQLELAFDEDAEVILFNHLIDKHDFRGFLQVIEPAPAFGDQGRSWQITAQGIESVLDQGKLASSVSWAAGALSILDGFQTVIALSIGLGPLRAFGSLTTGQGNQQFPIEPLNGASNSGALTIAAGTSVREALRQVWSSQDIGTDGWLGMLVTVDFTYGLRAWQDGPPFGKPDDYGTETIVDTVAGPNRATDLRYTKNPGSVARAVVVSWASGVVVVGDGSGKRGTVASFGDSSLTSAAAALSAGRAYLASLRTTDRGSYRQRDRAASATVRAGCRVNITDARLGLSATAFRIVQIDKTYNASNRENWTISFGGLAPSVASLIRRLTRSTVS